MKYNTVFHHNSRLLALDNLSAEENNMATTDWLSCASRIGGGGRSVLQADAAGLGSLAGPLEAVMNKMLTAG